VLAVVSDVDTDEVVAQLTPRVPDPPVSSPAVMVAVTVPLVQVPWAGLVVKFFRAAGGIINRRSISPG
jgi:hypothetical protein